MKRDKILIKAQKCLIKYNNSKSKYYSELNKVYNEYKNLEDVDPVMDKLYEKQINKLCLFVEESENFFSFLITLIIVIILIVVVVGFTTVKIINTEDSVKVVIEKANSEIDLNVEKYDKDFLLKYSTSDNYKELNPIYFELNPEGNGNYNIIYNMYLEINDFSGNVNNLVCVVSIDDKDYIYKLSNQSVVLDKYLIYTNSMNINDYKKINVRIFDDNINDDLSLFDYKFSFDAYLE